MVVAVVLLAIAFMCICRRKRRQKGSTRSEGSDAATANILEPAPPAAANGPMCRSRPMMSRGFIQKNTVECRIQKNAEPAAAPKATCSIAEGGGSTCEADGEVGNVVSSGAGSTPGGGMDSSEIVAPTLVLQLDEMGGDQEEAFVKAEKSCGQRDGKSQEHQHGAGASQAHSTNWAGADKVDIRALMPATTQAPAAVPPSVSPLLASVLTEWDEEAPSSAGTAFMDTTVDGGEARLCVQQHLAALAPRRALQHAALLPSSVAGAAASIYTHPALQSVTAGRLHASAQRDSAKLQESMAHFQASCDLTPARLAAGSGDEAQQRLHVLGGDAITEPRRRSRPQPAAQPTRPDEQPATERLTTRQSGRDFSAKLACGQRAALRRSRAPSAAAPSPATSSGGVACVRQDPMRLDSRPMTATPRDDSSNRGSVAMWRFSDGPPVGARPFTADPCLCSSESAAVVAAVTADVQREPRRRQASLPRRMDALALNGLTESTATLASLPTATTVTAAAPASPPLHGRRAALLVACAPALAADMVSRAQSNSTPSAERREAGDPISVESPPSGSSSPEQGPRWTRALRSGSRGRIDPSPSPAAAAEHRTAPAVAVMELRQRTTFNSILLRQVADSLQQQQSVSDHESRIDAIEQRSDGENATGTGALSEAARARRSELAVQSQTRREEAEARRLEENARMRRRLKQAGARVVGVERAVRARCPPAAMADRAPGARDRSRACD